MYPIGPPAIALKKATGNGGSDFSYLVFLVVQIVLKNKKPASAKA
jgi:hypothetical protein